MHHPSLLGAIEVEHQLIEGIIDKLSQTAPRRVGDLPEYLEDARIGREIETIGFPFGFNSSQRVPRAGRSDELTDNHGEVSTRDTASVPLQAGQHKTYLHRTCNGLSG